jgi:hypothetical protein
MHFGLTNALAIMQRLIDRVIALHKKYALAYMDDIIIFSPTFEQHLEHASSKPFLNTNSLLSRLHVASRTGRYVSLGLLLVTTASLPIPPMYVQSPISLVPTTGNPRHGVLWNGGVLSSICPWFD